MRQVYIMRGLEGSGTADWPVRNIGRFLEVSNITEFLKELRSRRPYPIVVKGEHIHLHEIAPYVTIGKEMYGARVTIVTCVLDPVKAKRDAPETLWKNNEKAHELRTALIPEEWGVEEIVHYEQEDGWYRPVGPHGPARPGGIIESIRRELRSVSPSVSRMRQMVGL